MNEHRGQKTAPGSKPPVLRPGPPPPGGSGVSSASEDGPRLIGVMLHVAEEPHRCRPPHGRNCGDGLGVNFLLPAGPPGSVWRCACGRLWQAGAGSWFGAGRWTRWHYRNVRSHVTTSPPAPPGAPPDPLPWATR